MSHVTLAQDVCPHHVIHASCAVIDIYETDLAESLAMWGFGEEDEVFQWACCHLRVWGCILLNSSSAVLFNCARVMFFGRPCSLAQVLWWYSLDCTWWWRPEERVHILSCLNLHCCVSITMSSGFTYGDNWRWTLWTLSCFLTPFFWITPLRTMVLGLGKVFSGSASLLIVL